LGPGPLPPPSPPLPSPPLPSPPPSSVVGSPPVGAIGSSVGFGPGAAGSAGGVGDGSLAFVGSGFGASGVSEPASPPGDPARGSVPFSSRGVADEPLVSLEA